MILLLVCLLAGCSGKKEGASPSPVTASAASPDPFRNVAKEAGVAFRLEPAQRPLRILESVGSGCAFLDYDGDGNLDALITGTPKCALFRNSGQGTFEEVTREAGLDASGTWTGCAAADYDGDGDRDLYVTGYGRSALYRNEGNGTFKDVTAATGTGVKAWGSVAAFADFDKDGNVDLYVGTYVKFGPHTKQYCILHESGEKTSCRPFDYDPEIGRCFRNRGDGTFEDVTRKWGLDRGHGKNLGICVGDFNNDGWSDFYLANDEVECDLFLNEKGKGFRNVSVEYGVAYSGEGIVMGGMGTDWGDYDNDGWLDLVVGTYEGEPKCLFRNRAGSAFEYVTPQAGTLADTYPVVVFGTLLFDYDNDGWKDLLYVNGHTMDNIQKVKPTSNYRQPSLLFRNQGGGTFQAVRSSALEVPIVGRGAASGDYDGDGDLDVLVTDMDGDVCLFQNQSAPRAHWLAVEPRATGKNTEALGARVTLTVDGKKQIGEVSPSRSYASSCDPRVHFGIGAAARVESVEVKWPSGETTRLTDVPADQVLTVRQGK